MAEDSGEDNRFSVADGDVGLHLAGSETRNAGRPAHRDCYRRIDLRGLGLDLRLDVPVSIGGRTYLPNDSVLFVLDGEIVIRDQRSRELPSPQKLPFVTPRTHPPRLR